MMAAQAVSRGAVSEVVRQSALLEHGILLQQRLDEAQQLTADDVRGNVARVGDGKEKGGQMCDACMAQSGAERARSCIASVADDERELVDFSGIALLQRSPKRRRRRRELRRRRMNREERRRSGRSRESCMRARGTAS